MGLVRSIPLPVRLPLIRAALATAQAAREPGWRRLPVSRSPGPLVVSGFLGEPLGIGRAADATADALEAAGYVVERQSLRPAQKAVWRLGPKPPVSVEPGGVWLIHANAPEAAFALMAHDPADWLGRYRIGYWAWETTVAPPEWARMVRWMDEIWAPSTFVADSIATTLRQANLPELADRLRVMPHPVQVPAGVRARPERFGLTAGVTHALVMFDARSAFARKNPWGAIEAWTRAFPQARSDARLVIKGSELSTDPGARSRLESLVAARSDMVLIEERLSSAELWDLLASIDLLISLHRSEGFGLVPAEVMALGKPVVMTGWSGVLDFADDQSAALVPARLVDVHDPSGAYYTGQWGEPDLDAAARAISDLIEHPDKARRLGAQGPSRIDRLATAWSTSALQSTTLASLIDNSDRRPAP